MSMPTDNVPESNASLGLVDLLLILARHKKLMLVLPGIVIVLALIYVFVATKTYQSEVTLMPPQQQQPTMPSISLGALSGGGGLSAGGLLGLKNPNDMYVGLLGLPSMARIIIDRFKLIGHFETNTYSRAIKMLAHETTITAGKDNLIYITVEDPDRNLAADIANAYAEELQNMLDSAAIQEAKPRRIYFETLLKQTRDNMTNAETAMTKMQNTSGVVDIDAQAHATIEAMGELRAAITEKDVEIHSATTFATTNNPDLKILFAEKSALEGQLRQLSHGVTDKDDPLVVKAKAPQLAMEYMRKLRDVKYFEALFEMVAHQYEAARMDEAKQGAVVQVVEKALPAEEKFRPKRGLIVLASAIASFFFAALVAFTKENMARNHDEKTAEKWGEFRAIVLGKSHRSA